MPEPKYMPLNSTETSQLQFFHSLYRVLKDDDSLKPRFSSLNMWWRYKGMLKQAEKMFAAAWETIEPEKRRRMNFLWSNQELRIVNAGQPVDPTGDLIMIPKRTIMHWAQELQAEKCALCMGNNNDRKDCLFRKGMVEMSLPDLRRQEKKYGKCMGKIFDWSDR